jgi:alpha-L-fucosidase 2
MEVSFEAVSDQWSAELITEDYTDIMGSVDNYGTYETLGNLTVKIANLSSSSSYRRSLDLSTGVHTVTYEANGSNFTQ